MFIEFIPEEEHMKKELFRFKCPCCEEGLVLEMDYLEEIVDDYRAKEKVKEFELREMVGAIQENEIQETVDSAIGFLKAKREIGKITKKK